MAEETPVKKVCASCDWYAISDGYWEGVCCNGRSEYRADYRDMNDSCPDWDRQEPGHVWERSYWT